MDKESLKSLIKQAQRGDRIAFEEIYRIFIKSIFYHTGILLDDQNEVEDTVQEIVLKMYRNIGDLKHAEAFKSWLHRIITTTCINKNMKNGRSAVTFDLDDYADTMPTDNVEVLPEEFVLRGSQNDTLAKIIEQLPRARRQAIVMYYYDEMSYKEIAKATGVSVSTVSTNILMAKRTIEEGMNKDEQRELDATGRAVSAAIALEVDKLYPDHFLEQFCTKCDAGLKNITPVHHRTSTRTVHRVLIAASTAVIVLSATLIANINTGYEKQYEKYLTDPYNPKAVIELKGDDCPDGHVNPMTAALSLDDAEGKILGWKITKNSGDDHSSDVIVLEGSGTKITSALNNLPEGSYSITWTVANQEGNKAQVIRDILIIDGPVEPGAYK
jgi:RNA polymerase sigma-70 factor (ECF subfamily)